MDAREYGIIVSWCFIYFGDKIIRDLGKTNAKTLVYYYLAWLPLLVFTFHSKTDRTKRRTGRWPLTLLSQSGFDYKRDRRNAFLFVYWKVFCSLSVYLISTAESKKPNDNTGELPRVSFLNREIHILYKPVFNFTSTISSFGNGVEKQYTG